MKDNSFEIMRTTNLFSQGNTEAWDYISQFIMPWEALSGLREFIIARGTQLSGDDYKKCGDDVWIHKTATVAPSAFIGSAVIIGADTEIRHGAFIRESAFIGRGAVVGNSTELKNVLLFDGVQVPHYNYAGDSILGYKAHMGAGSITSNAKSDKTEITVNCCGVRCATGLRKFGAVLGDFVEVGCNSVLNPGSVVGARAFLYPLSFVRGYIPADCIYKRQGEVSQRN